MPRISELNELEILTNTTFWPVLESGSVKRVSYENFKSSVLTPATTSSTGVVKIGSGLAVDSEGKVQVIYQYTLPQASTTRLGGVKVDGQTIIIDPNGVISATVTGGEITLDELSDVNTANKVAGQVLKWSGTDWQNFDEYELPAATAGTLGGVKVGSGLTVTQDGTLSATMVNPSLTTTQRDALASKTQGMIIFNTTTSKFQGYTGSDWVDLH